MEFKAYYHNKALKERYSVSIAHKKSIGSDGLSADQFEKNLEEETELIEKKVDNFKYRFSPFKEKLILKDKMSPPRAVYVPTVRDRLLLSALNAYLTEELKPYSLNYSKSARKVIDDVLVSVNSGSYDCFIKIDISNFYPSLNHDILSDRVSCTVSDPKARSIIKKVLNRSESGIAQGLSVSSILASLYISPLDDMYQSREDFKYYRYVDDILILCKIDDAETIKSKIFDSIDSLKLKVNRRKTEEGLILKDSFFYLGYQIGSDCISVKAASIKKLESRIESVFKDAFLESESSDGDFEEAVISRINLKITGCLYNKKPYGWLFYFNKIDDIKLLYYLDWYVKKICTRHKVDCEKGGIKSFVKTYYKMKRLKYDKLDSGSYIPSYCYRSKLPYRLAGGKNIKTTEPLNLDNDSEFLKIVKQLRGDVATY